MKPEFAVGALTKSPYAYCDGKVYRWDNNQWTMLARHDIMLMAVISITEKDMCTLFPIAYNTPLVP